MHNISEISDLGIRVACHEAATKVLTVLKLMNKVNIS